MEWILHLDILLEENFLRATVLQAERYTRIGHGK